MTHTLSVGLAGSGVGRVIGPGFDCPGDCDQTAVEGERAELTPEPASGSRFAGWSGDCSGAGGCALIATADRFATATFELKAHSDLSLKASKRRVRRGRLVTLEVVALPCHGRDGDEVTLLKRGKPVDSVALGFRRCRARFRERVRRETTYSAQLATDELHLADEAEPEQVKIEVRRRKARR